MVTTVQSGRPVLTLGPAACGYIKVSTVLLGMAAARSEQRSSWFVNQKENGSWQQREGNPKVLSALFPFFSYLCSRAMQFFGPPWHEMPMDLDVDYASFSVFFNITNNEAWYNASTEPFKPPMSRNVISEMVRSSLKQTPAGCLSESLSCAVHSLCLGSCLFCVPCCRWRCLT